jgi:hypothetical protein
MERKYYQIKNSDGETLIAEKIGECFYCTDGGVEPVCLIQPKDIKELDI